MALHDYDADELRRCASEINGAADELSGEIAGQLRRACEDAQYDLAGSTARALQAAFQALISELDDISDDLQALGSEISAAADSQPM